MTVLTNVVQRYNLNYLTVSGDLVPGHTIAMSSYAGTLFSMDDFYTLSSGLVTLETTLFVYNITLFDLVTPLGTMWEPVRVMVANRLARNGQEWTEIFRCVWFIRLCHVCHEIFFSRYNDGTYNNQWMVLDYNKKNSNRVV